MLVGESSVVLERLSTWHGHCLGAVYALLKAFEMTFWFRKIQRKPVRDLMLRNGVAPHVERLKALVEHQLVIGFGVHGHSTLH